MMHKKRKLSISPLVPKEFIKETKVCLATPTLIWERQPSKYNPIIIIDDTQLPKTI